MDRGFAVTILYQNIICAKTPMRRSGEEGRADWCGTAIKAKKKKCESGGIICAAVLFKIHFNI